MNSISADQLVAQRKSARWARLQLLFELPRLAEILHASQLYERDGEFWLVVNAEDDVLATIASTLDRERPVTLCIAVVRNTPSAALPLAAKHEGLSDTWLVDYPLTKGEINALVSLADRTLPAGTMDFDLASQSYEFVSPEELSLEDSQRVMTAANKIGIPLRRFRTSAVARSKVDNGLTLATSRQLPALPPNLRQVMEADEDNWRDFCDRRDHDAPTLQPSLTPNLFCGLMDGNAQGSATLADLLAIYDVVHLLPPDSGSTWLKTNNLSLDQLQQLAAMGRVQLVLPQSLQTYPVGLITAVADAAPQSIMLSRTLATRAIAEGQKRDPLLHAPIPSEAKAALLSALIEVLPEALGTAACLIYQQPLKRQQLSLMMQGAGAWLVQSLGARLGEALFLKGQPDSRLEFMTAGAGVEWAMALQATYVPRRYEDYDETRLAVRLASLISKRPAREILPATDSMHCVVQGLLTIGELSPMEVAQLAPGARGRFRMLAQKLMTQSASAQELQLAVDAINRAVTAFESKRERLRFWAVTALPPLVISKALSDGADAGFPFASIIGAWLAILAHRRIPKVLNAEMNALVQSLMAMSMLTPVDAVIVSQTLELIVRRCLGLFE